ncbi:unnamed protein product [Sphagnum jensenii]|uniref:Uncharacterized protein n=1 Tax=Sphagnum jensenii TaxID=128206 RepID=A0ABP0V9J2_9BRYO
MGQSPTFMLKSQTEEDHEGLDQYFLSAWQGDSISLEYFLKQGMDVGRKNELGSSALKMASDHGHEDCVSILLKHGAGNNMSDVSNSVTAASTRGHASCLKLLLPHVVENRTLKGPLFESCTSGSVDCVRLLVEKGADVNARNNTGQTPLILACFFGHSGCAEYLISKEANLDLTDDRSNTALYYASTRGHIKCVEALVYSGADQTAGSPIPQKCGTADIAEFLQNDRQTVTNFVLK